ncbi:MAG: energy transducer TonB [Bacteroidota bacterium]
MRKMALALIPVSLMLSCQGFLEDEYDQPAPEKSGPSGYDPASSKNAERPARFPGGDKAFIQFLSGNIQWPGCCDSAMAYGTQGKVYLKFIVEKNGSIGNIEVVKAPEGRFSEQLSNEAIRVVSLSPKWIPAMKDGKAARMYFTVPINFKLR